MRKTSIAGAARFPSVPSTPSALSRVERPRPRPVDGLYRLGLLELQLRVSGGGEQGEDGQRGAAGRSCLPPAREYRVSQNPWLLKYSSNMAPPPYTLSDLRYRRADIEDVAARHHATNIRVVGSAARGDADELSDIDLMVDMDPSHKLNGFAYFGELDRLEKELAALLHCDVDVVDAAGILANAQLLTSSAHVRDNMMRDAVAL